MPSALRPPFDHCDHIDPEELEAAWRLLKSVGRRLDWIARQHGWPAPFAPARYLILSVLERQPTLYGLTPRRLARALALRPPTIAHHLDVLEDAGLIQRYARTIYDRRKITIRLTAGGSQAVRWFSGEASD